MSRVRACLLAAIALLLALPAGAQRAADNAVTSASDAFGTVVGNQTIGLYNPTDARGFDPTQAQNVRIEGLYFDQQTSGIDPYVFKGSDMRVGVAAQAYAFPSPSGIVDLNLRIPGDSPAASAVLTRGPLQGYSAELDTSIPVKKDFLTLGLDLGTSRNFDIGYALTSSRRAISMLALFQPNSSLEVIPFYAYVHNDEHNNTPIVYGDRVHPLPVFDEQHLPTEDWTRWGWNQTTAGVITKAGMGDGWRVRAGVFHSMQREAENFNNLLLGLTLPGIGDNLIDVAPARTASSYSGDFRLMRVTSDDVHQRALTFAVRGRHSVRSFGGDSFSDLGLTSIHDYTQVPEPVLAFSDQNHDRVQQTGVGMNYAETWKDRASLSLGLLWTDYSRKLEVPETLPHSEHAIKLMPTASFAANASKHLTFYGSYTQGLEDSAIAPTSAANRGEPPPATPTWQVDGGARLNLKPYLQLMVGAFEVHKSYFNLDTANRYTRLGDISSQGIESSATFTGPEGLTVIAGGVWLRPEVRRQIAEEGGSGETPVGPVPRTLELNVDYAPSFWRGWGSTVQWKSLSARVETADDLYRLPPLATLNVGARYLFKAFARSFSARLDVDNITNANGLTLSSSYQAIPQLGRNYVFTFAADI